MKKLYMAYHENGGNESFRIKGMAMLTIKATSDPCQQHNMLVADNYAKVILYRE